MKNNKNKNHIIIPIKEFISDIKFAKVVKFNHYEVNEINSTVDKEGNQIINYQITGENMEINYQRVFKDKQKGPDINEILKMILDKLEVIDKRLTNVEDDMIEVKTRLINVETDMVEVKKDISLIKQCPTIQKEIKLIQK